MTSEAIGKTNGPETVGNSDDPPSSPVSDTAPDGTVAGDGVDAENGTNAVESGYNDRNSRGQFVPGNKGGPGRGRYSNGSKTGDAVAEGEGELSTTDLMTLLDNAIRRRGDKFWNELVKERPVVAAQLRQVLIKSGGASAAAEPVTIHLGDGLAALAANIMAPPTGDVADLDLPAARAEVVRLMAENDRLQRQASGLAPLKSKEPDKPLLPVPSKEAVECPDCAGFMKITGRMIEPLSKCRFCGQLYEDAVAKPMIWTRNRPLPGPDDRPGSGVAFSIPMDGSERGWSRVDVSHGVVPGIHAALARPQRGVFE